MIYILDTSNRILNIAARKSKTCYRVRPATPLATSYVYLTDMDSGQSLGFAALEGWYDYDYTCKIIDNNIITAKIQINLFTYNIMRFTNDQFT